MRIYPQNDTHEHENRARDLIQSPESKIQNFVSFRVFSWMKIFVLLCVCVGAGACLSGQFASVHFNSGMPDFGTPPRRGVVSFRGELSDRQETTETYEGAYPETELSEDKDKARDEARQKSRMTRLAAAQKAEAAGQWAEAQRQIERVAQTNGWTGELRDRVEILEQLLKNNSPLPAPFAALLQNYFQSVSAADSPKTPGSRRRAGCHRRQSGRGLAARTRRVSGGKRIGDGGR